MTACFKDMKEMSCTERRIPVFRPLAPPLAASVGPSMELSRGSTSPHHLVCAMEGTRCSPALVSDKHNQEGR